MLVSLENLMSSLPKIHRSLSEPILNRCVCLWHVIAIRNIISGLIFRTRICSALTAPLRRLQSTLIYPASLSGLTSELSQEGGDSSLHCFNLSFQSSVLPILLTAPAVQHRRQQSHQSTAKEWRYIYSEYFEPFMIVYQHCWYYCRYIIRVILKGIICAISFGRTIFRLPRVSVKCSLPGSQAKLSLSEKSIKIFRNASARAEARESENIVPYRPDSRPPPRCRLSYISQGVIDLLTLNLSAGLRGIASASRLSQLYEICAITILLSLPVLYQIIWKYT